MRDAAEGGFPEGGGPKTAGAARRPPWHYLADHEGVDRPVRFDNVSLVVFGESKAFLRHHINALSDAIPDIAGNTPFPRGSPKTSSALAEGRPRPSGRGLSATKR